MLTHFISEKIYFTEFRMREKIAERAWPDRSPELGMLKVAAIGPGPGGPNFQLGQMVPLGQVV